MNHREQNRQKMLRAKPDIDAAIKKYGLAAVKYVVARRSETEALSRQLAAEKKKLNERMAEIEAKLKRK